MENFTFSKDYLNIAEYSISNEVLGPGKRFVIWTQGCCFDCQDCCAPEWQKFKSSILIKPKDLAKIILNEKIDGITISGGEPMLQAENLDILLKIIHSDIDIGIICYTGYNIDDLKNQNNKRIDSFLKEIDVLIDGTYVNELNDNKGWRGSSNQNIYFLTERYRKFEKEFIERKRNIEIHLTVGGYLMVGIKPVWADEYIRI